MNENPLSLCEGQRQGSYGLKCVRPQHINGGYRRYLPEPDKLG